VETGKSRGSAQNSALFRKLWSLTIISGLLVMLNVTESKHWMELQIQFNQFTPHALSAYTQRSVVFSWITTRTILKLIIVSRANRVQPVSWYRHKLGWTVKNYQSGTLNLFLMKHKL